MTELEMTRIGRISNISAREAWNHEAHDFTPWLANNLDRLGEVIGVNLEPEGVEVAVDTFSADILARDTMGRLVLIENQLDATDHKHLGQILTYLSGLEAEVIIWVASDFRDAHLSAVNWLNENTDDQFSFFAIKLRVIRIGDSDLAPIFDVLARPNEWDRQVQKVVREKTGEFSDYGIERRDFWSHYLSRYPGDEHFGATINGSTSQWLTPNGVTDLKISMYKAKKGVGVFLRGNRGSTPSEIQHRLAPFSEEFKNLVGQVSNIGDFENHPSDELKIDTLNARNWDEAVDWLHNRAHTFLTATSEIFGTKTDKD